MDGKNGDVIASGGFERVTNHEEVINQALAELIDQGNLNSINDIDAVGF